ncbi:MAG: histidine kinase [Marinilabiliaceae bacterium]|jgi:sensor histidine kinase YesM|nr:histidine kinase [Marinilabiliaceae bacterium]
MKKYLIFLVLVLCTLNLFPQGKAIFRGKIDNYYATYVNLTVYRYNPETVKTESERLSKRIGEDGSFEFIIGDLDFPFTECSFSMGGGAPVFISPGDSIVYYSNYWTQKESIEYSGKGAARNNYLKEKYLYYESNPYKSHSNNSIDPEKFKHVHDTRYEELIAYINQDSVLRLADSAFYQYELRMIACQAIYDAFTFYRINYRKFPENKVPDYLDQHFSNSVTDVEDYLYAPETREFLNNYVSYRIIKEKSGTYFDIAPGLLLDWSSKNLMGESLRTYQTDLLNKLLDRVNTDVAKVRLLEYLDSRVADKQLKAYIAKQQSLLKEQSFNIPHDLRQSAMRIIVFSLVILAIFLAIKRLGSYLKGRGLRISINRVIQYLVYATVIILIIVFLAQMIPYRGIIVIFYPVIILATLFLHIKILIPVFALNKRVISYCLLVAALIISDIFLFELLAFADGQNIISGFAYDILQMQFWFSFALVLSWLFYLLLYSEKHKIYGTRKLIEAGRFSWEYTILIIILLIINALATGNARHNMGFTGLIYTYALIVIFLIINFSLVPRFIKTRSWITFISSLLIILISQGIVLILAESVQSALLLKQQNIELRFTDTISFRYGLDMSNILFTFLLLIPAAFYNYIKWLLQEKETRGFKLFRQKEAELLHLRSQVNPHFLFNSLNTIYSYALKEKNDKTAEPIAKLSNLMRFMIDDMDREFIALEREAEYIKDYVQLQSIRSSVQHDISINISIDYSDAQIAPMLLIPFVENAFKHGINPGVKSMLKIDLKASRDKIQFLIENSLLKGSHEFEKESGFGIGVENVKQRLEYIYPGLHKLSIAETKEKYIVILDIASKKK